MQDSLLHFNFLPLFVAGGGRIRLGQNVCLAEMRVRKRCSCRWTRARGRREMAEMERKIDVTVVVAGSTGRRRCRGAVVGARTEKVMYLRGLGEEEIGLGIVEAGALGGDPLGEAA